MLVEKVSDTVREQAPDRWIHSDPDKSDRFCRADACDSFGFLHLRYELLASLIVTSTRLGHRHVSRRPIEELDAEICLKRSYDLGKDRWHDVQVVCRCRERLRFDDAAKKLDGTKLVH